MAEAALPALGESLMAESFVAAAPEMFIAPEAMGAEFGTEALFSGLGAEGFGGLSALGSEFGTEALLSGAGETVPTLGEGIAQNVTSGGLGAGETGINEAMVNAQQAQAVNSGFSQAELEAMQRGQELAQNAPVIEQTAGYGLKGSMLEPTIADTGAALENTYSLSNANPSITEGIKSSGLTPTQSALPNQYSLNQGLNYGSPISAANTTAAAPSGLEAGFNKALNYVKENPFSAASMGYSAMKLLGGDKKQEEAPAGYNGILSKYKMSPNFQGRQANPQDFQYTPRVYAEGGIASFKSGGKSDSLDPTGGSKLAMDYYESMQRQQAKDMPSTRSDMGIYYDLDPDTRYLDPVTAAQVRMAKINKRANIQAANMKRPTPMGQINLTPPGVKTAAAASSLDPETMAAHGGIMHSSLGGYATGGNPRLLKGPGDGMSDNIPATIAGKQPARLADGEFVIPADVVSHLGNGSTEAGAKVLHAMMTKVRKERTGNPKQGKQINPRKFVPT
jgi:hypothetical protein